MTNPGMTDAPPTHVDELTPEYMTYLLGLADGDDVVSVTPSSTFQGAASRVRLAVTYARPQETLPSSFFLKTIIETRDEVDETLAAIRAGTGPGMYSTEVRFYQQIRPHLEAESPRVFASEFFPESGRFLVLLEDLAARGARFPTAAQPVTVDEAAGVLDTLARLHARYWASLALDGDLAWVDTPLSGEFTGFIRAAGPAMYETESRVAFKTPFHDRMQLDPDRLFEAFWRLQDLNASAEPILLHGDPHFANLYVLPDGTCGLLDWALLRRGCWAHDVSYFLGGSLPVEQRRAHEEVLLRGYLDALSVYGAPAPDYVDAWRDYQQNMLWGYLIWFLTPAPIHPPEAIVSNLERFAAALTDHHVLAQLGY